MSETGAEPEKNLQVCVLLELGLVVVVAAIVAVVAAAAAAAEDKQKEAAVKFMVSNFNNVEKSFFVLSVFSGFSLN